MNKKQWISWLFSCLLLLAAAPADASALNTALSSSITPIINLTEPADDTPLLQRVAGGLAATVFEQPEKKNEAPFWERAAGNVLTAVLRAPDEKEDRDLFSRVLGKTADPAVELAGEEDVKTFLNRVAKDVVDDIAYAAAGKVADMLGFQLPERTGERTLGAKKTPQKTEISETEAVQPLNEQELKKLLGGKTIVVDPGHGGYNPGATGFGAREADHNLAVSLKLRDKLAAAGAKVVMTRTTDRAVAKSGGTLSEELQARVDIAEANRADLFVSVHTNHNDNPAVKGAMTFYNSDKSARLAEGIQNELVKSTGAANKGTAHASFYVLRKTSMPAVLVEMGFISNRDEAAKLAADDYRDAIAAGLLRGIALYFR